MSQKGILVIINGHKSVVIIKIWKLSGVFFCVGLAYLLPTQNYILYYLFKEACV